MSGADPTEPIDHPDVETVWPDDVPGYSLTFQHMQAVDEGYGVAGWYVAEWYSGDDFDGYSILLSYLFDGEPPVEHVARTLNHEYLHAILEKLEGDDASDALDNIVGNGGKYLVEREANETVDPNAPV